MKYDLNDLISIISSHDIPGILGLGQISLAGILRSMVNYFKDYTPSYHTHNTLGGAIPHKTCILSA